MRFTALTSRLPLTLKNLFIICLLTPFAISCAEMEEFEAEELTTEKNYYDTLYRVCYDAWGYQVPCQQTGYQGSGVCYDGWGNVTSCGDVVEVGNQNNNTCYDSWGYQVSCGQNQQNNAQCTDAWGYPAPCTWI